MAKIRCTLNTNADVKKKKKKNEQECWRRKDNAPQTIKEPQGGGTAKERMAGTLRASELEAT